jgi:biopolymer transport protein ExbD
MARQRTRSEAGELGRYVSPRKARERGPRSTVMQPPLTPMIDVVFQLLLFFLLACQFRAQEGLIPANLPDLSGPRSLETIKKFPIQINIYPTGPANEGALFRIKDTDLQFSSAGALCRYLIEFGSEEEREEVPVVIKSIGFVRWEHVVNAFNQAVLARYKRIGLAPSIQT